MAGYTFDAEGRISNPAEVLILEDPVILMRTVTPLTLRDGALCGALRDDDIAQAEFSIGGAAATAEQTASLRTTLAQQLAPMVNAEVCTRFAAADGGFMATPWFQGTERPELAQRVIWVRPDEGYRVAP